ncbi:ankyrin repeat domain-containing protein [Glaciecola sp. MH2013]|nr:ankyrin repeat domain-containing protein [Glaciecola sp. MH2013]
MIDAGAKIDVVDITNRNLMFYAIDSGHSELVNYLYRNNIDIHAEDSLGWTALEWAVINDKSHLFKDLLIKEHTIPNP